MLDLESRGSTAKTLVLNLTPLVTAVDKFKFRVDIPLKVSNQTLQNVLLDIITVPNFILIDTITLFGYDRSH